MTNPVALATTVWGSGLRRALLLHGLTSAASTWWRVGPSLAELGFTVVAPDLRAHGKSPKGDSVSIDSYRDDVRLLGGGWDLVVGHSLGGAIAAAVVAADPGFTKRLVLEDPAIDSQVTAEFIADSPEPMRHPTIAAVAAENPDWHERDVELKVEALLACGPDIVERTMADATPWNLWSEMLAAPVPTLIFAADVEMGTLVSAEREKEAGSAASLDVIRVSGAGHSIHRDAFVEFDNLLQGFVED